MDRKTFETKGVIAKAITGSVLRNSKVFTAVVIFFCLIGSGNFFCFGQTAAVLQKGHLFVETDPPSAKVRILNIKPKFYQGMELDPGKYFVEVSTPGYVMVKKWVEVVAGEKKKIIVQLDPTKESIEKVFYDLKLGSIYKAAGRYENAVKTYKEALRIDPDNVGAHYGLGGAYFYLGRYEDAAGAFRQVIRIDPDNAEAHFSLGLNYKSLGRYEDAAEAFKQAIRVNPDHAEAHYMLGLIYSTLEKTGLALEEYETLKRLDPKKAEELFNLI